MKTTQKNQSDDSVIKVGYGCAQGTDGFNAGQQACQKALGMIPGQPISIVFVFTSVHYDLASLLRGIHAVIGDVPVIGATTAGEVCNGLNHHSVVVAMLASSFVKVHVGLGRNVSKDWRAAVEEAIHKDEIRPYFDPENENTWRDVRRQGESVFAMLFSPGNTRQDDSKSYEILIDLRKRSRGLVPICGGSAADDWRMETNYVIYNQTAYPDSMLIAVFESQIQVGIGLAHGFKPSDRKATITRADNHEVIELDHQRADKVYAELLGFTYEELRDKHLTLATSHPVGFANPYGEYYINIASYFTPNGGVRFAQPVPEGAILIIMEAEPESMIAAGRDACRKAALRGGISQPALVLMFTCALRNRILGDRTAEEIESVRKAARNAGVVGFLSFGEQGIADSGAIHHNNEVVSVLVFGTQLTPAAEVWYENQRLLAERTLAEQALRESETRFRIAAKAASDIIYEWDLSDNTVEWFGHIEGILGYQTDEIPKTISGWIDLVHPEDHQHCIHAIEHYQEFKEIVTFEYRVKHKNGSWRYWVFRGLPVKNPEGHILRWIGSCSDVTAQKVYDETLRRAKEEWERTFDSIPDLICLLDSDFRILRINKTMTNRLNINPEEAIGRTCYELIHESATIPAFCPHAKTLSERSCQRSEIQENRLGGIFYITTTPVFDQNGDLLYSIHVARDITREKQAQQERLELERRMQQMQRLESLGVLAGGIAHDFNNILMAILGNVDMALLDLSELSPIREYLSEIEMAARRGAELTRQMLAYSGKGRFVIKMLNLSELIEEMMGLLKSSIPKNVTIRTRLDRQLPFIEADIAQIQQIVMNLTTNAAEAYSEEDDGQALICTGVMHCDHKYLADTVPDVLASYEEPLPEGDYVYLEVADNGCGMDEETKKRVFEPFFTTKFTGRGLGMAAVLGIVRGHRGAIRLYSEPGEGTTFKILLPAVVDTVKQEVEIPKIDELKQWHGTGTVLVVDDENQVRDLARRMLERLGFSVLVAANGQEAVRIYREQSKQITCILLDLSMPGLSGEETFRELKRLEQNARVIMSSGYNEQEVIQRFAGKGFAGFIQKPYQIRILGEKIKEVLGE